ncbi:hypothetical protein GCM10011610_09930 [Nocardia rhizosphaerihabitans]|uniref:Uncharacterized protein n=1 Tax=Nocardia rhizosphaerihabitans TaxID=1691570 RepID=A0ABQ2K5P5_9NOCA|nr:hypothetical protein GCM10011610_09930 [Nocardia rhizosphaerihabitans]
MQPIHRVIRIQRHIRATRAHDRVHGDDQLHTAPHRQPDQRFGPHTERDQPPRQHPHPGVEFGIGQRLGAELHRDTVGRAGQLLGEPVDQGRRLTRRRQLHTQRRHGIARQRIQQHTERPIGRVDHTGEQLGEHDLHERFRIQCATGQLGHQGELGIEIDIGHRGRIELDRDPCRLHRRDRRHQRCQLFCSPARRSGVGHLDCLPSTDRR